MRQYGNHPDCRATRLVDTSPHGHWKTSTFIADLREDGLIAPAVFDGAINGELFLDYVEQILVPTLRPDDIVMMDNLASHKRPAVRQEIEAAGATVRFLTPLQPRLEPDRGGVRQDKGASAGQGATPRRRAVERSRRYHRLCLARRVQKLHPPCWLFSLRVKML